MTDDTRVRRRALYRARILKGRDRLRNALFAATRSRVARNIVANYAGTVISAAAPLLALPFLLAFLGPAMWGLVAFATLLVSVLAILNAGLAQSMVREFGARWASGAQGRARTARLLRSYERLYWIAALVVAACAFPLAGQIVHRWLDVSQIPTSVALDAVRLAVILFFVQLPSAVYRTVLSALQEQVPLNVVQVTSAIVKSLGGVLVAFQTRSVLGYLGFLVAVNLVETLTLAVLAWRRMPSRRADSAWDWREVRNTFRFSATMSGVVVLGVMTTMIDKFFVSGKFPIEQLGIYAIASSVGMGVLQACYPIFNAILPKLVEVGNDQGARVAVNLLLLKLVAPIIICGAVAYGLVGREVLAIWLHDRELSIRVAAILDLILISSVMNMIYNIAYTNWVSLGSMRWIIFVNVASFVTAIVVTPYSIDAFGLKGAAAALIIINAVGALSGVTWLMRFAVTTRSDMATKSG